MEKNYFEAWVHAYKACTPEMREKSRQHWHACYEHDKASANERNNPASLEVMLFDLKMLRCIYKAEYELIQDRIKAEQEKEELKEYIIRRSLIYT